MDAAAPSAIAIAQVIDRVMREDRGRMMAGLVARLGDFDLAEDALHEAAVAAMKTWAGAGIPRAPVNWLMKVALNRGIDRLRAAGRLTGDAALAHLSAPDLSETEDIPDDRLRLIFTCCHPALEEKSRVALTLRSICYLTTGEIARAFLDQEPTMGQRLSRAKRQIARKGIAFAVPPPDQWAGRLRAVLATLYLIYTTGYVNEDQGDRDLCGEAIFLIRLLDRLRPGDAEIEGAMALMLLTYARRRARVGADGTLVPIEHQDHALWDAALLEEARAVLTRAVARGAPGAFQIKAAIADCHMGADGSAPAPDWMQMSFLYQSLWAHEPTAVVALNWAVVLAESGHVALALERVEALAEELSRFQPWHAARADLLRRMGRMPQAREAYDRAIDMAPSAPARLFLTARRAEIDAIA